MMHINKFNIHWQVVRVEARNIASTTEKLKYVEDFLERYPNIHNYGRVMNWLRMYRMAVSRMEQEEYDRYIDYLRRNAHRYMDKEDMDNNFDGVSTDKLIAVLWDLDKRRYAFLYGGHVPRDHVEFIRELDKHIAQRVLE